MFNFQVTHTHGAARRGVLTTPHGVVNTPAFMAVGTQGAVKAVTQRDLEDLGSEIVLANTYHLYLRPGADRIARLGGLHTFMGWDKPILTDSGGYQVFSLAARRTVQEEGATFRSHLDGSEHLLTPESAVDIQAQLGSDVAMVLDECLEYPASHDRARESLERTLRWAKRGRDHFVRLRNAFLGSDPRDIEGVRPVFTNPGQAQFGIIQGGTYPDLRRRSVDETVAIGFEAYAIGGLSVGEPIAEMYDVTERDRAVAAGRSPAVSDGRRHASRPGGKRRSRDRYVRLRPADAQCPQRTAIHERRPSEHQECRVCGG